MDFVGMIVHTKYILYFIGTYLVHAWYILHTRTDLHESEHDICFCRERARLEWENQKIPPRNS
jgi:hypothetical protein